MFQLLWLPQICYLIAKKIDAQNMLIITSTNFSKCFIWICMHVLCIRNRNALFQIILQVFRSILVTGREVHCVVLSSKEKGVWKIEDGHLSKTMQFCIQIAEESWKCKSFKFVEPCTFPTEFALFLLHCRDWIAWETVAGPFEVKLHFMKL